MKNWEVLYHREFLNEFNILAEEVRLEISAVVELLEAAGPHLERPRCDTLKGSKHARMKELRFGTRDEVWRIAFAFDPKRRAILLVGGDKSGISQKRFYRKLIATADRRFDVHLESMRKDQRR